jgi:hypothetical protein
VVLLRQPFENFEMPEIKTNIPDLHQRKNELENALNNTDDPDELENITQELDKVYEAIESSGEDIFQDGFYEEDPIEKLMKEASPRLQDDFGKAIDEEGKLLGGEIPVEEYQNYPISVLTDLAKGGDETARQVLSSRLTKLQTDKGRQELRYEQIDSGAGQEHLMAPKDPYETIRDNDQRVSSDDRFFENLLTPEEKAGRDVNLQRQKNRLGAFTRRILKAAGEALGDPNLANNTGIVFRKPGQTSMFSEGILYLDPLAKPETVVHELAHNKATHTPEFGKVDKGESVAGQIFPEPEETAYIDVTSPTGVEEGTRVEFPIEQREHTYENLDARAGFDPTEHQFQTANEALMRNPEIAQAIKDFNDATVRNQEGFNLKESGRDIPLREKETTTSAPSEEGRLNPTRDIPADEQIQMVIRGEKPAAIYEGTDAEFEALKPSLDQAGISYYKTRGEWRVAKDPEVLDRLVNTLDPREEGRLLGYSEADLDAYDRWQELPDSEKSRRLFPEDYKRARDTELGLEDVEEAPPKPREDRGLDRGEGGPRLVTSAPSEEGTKSYRVTYSDNTTEIFDAPNPGEAAKLARATERGQKGRLKGISEKSSDYKPGEVRADLGDRRGTYRVKLRDPETGDEFTRTARDVYSGSQAERQVLKAYEDIGRKYEVVGSEPIGVAAKGTSKETSAPEEPKEVSQAREAVEEQLGLKKSAKEKADEMYSKLEEEDRKARIAKYTEELPEYEGSIKVDEGPPTTKDGEGSPPDEVSLPVDEGEEGKAISYTVKLSDGHKTRTKAKSPEEAQEIIEAEIEAEGSYLTVEDVQVTPTRLQQHLRTKREVNPELSPEEARLADKVNKAQEVEDIEGKKVASTKEDTEFKERVKLIDEITKGQAEEEIKIRKAKEREEAKKAREAANKEAQKLEKGPIDDLTDIPKTLKAAFDISWPGRQGLFVLNRPQALKGIGRGTVSVVPFKGRANHQAVQADLASRPNAELYEQAGLNQIKYDPTEISQRAEEIPSELAAKMPGIRHSSRAFTDAGNLARANLFDQFAEKFQAQGKTFDTHPELYKGMADYLNVLTMRKPLGKKFQQAGWILNKLFFSPMAAYSRLQLINPMWYARLPKEMQKEALRDIGGTLAAITGMMGAAAAVLPDDVEVSFDPTHTHFGRLKVGKTYYDFGGITPQVRTLARVLTGIKTTPKGTYELPGGLGIGKDKFFKKRDIQKAKFGQDAFGELQGFVENKTSPLYHATKGALTRRGWQGKEYGFSDMLMDLFVPMPAESMIEAGREYGSKEALKQTPDIFGIGTMTEFPDRGKKGKKSKRYDLSF